MPRKARSARRELEPRRNVGHQLNLERCPRESVQRQDTGAPWLRAVDDDGRRVSFAQQAPFARIAQGGERLVKRGGEGTAHHRTASAIWPGTSVMMASTPSAANAFAESASFTVHTLISLPSLLHA